LESLYKDVVVAYFKAKYQHLFGRIEEMQGKSQAGDSNLGTPEYEVGVRSDLIMCEWW
jgi:hypothetical protein